MLLNTVLIMICLAAAVQSTIVITSPLQTGFANNQIDYLYFNFGEIPYGKTLTFDIFITQKSLCQVQDLQHFNKPTYVVAKVNYLDSCSLTKKALVAQSIGAKGIVLASEVYDRAVGKIYKGDDGNGRRVHITSLMISNGSFEQLKSLKNVEIIVNFPIPKQPKSTLSIFISASKRSSYVFLRQFSEHYKYLKNHTQIELVYHTVSCNGCSTSNCLMQSYCCYDYQNYRYDVGQKIILQQLNQFQIYKQRGVETWLQYMDLFDQFCISNWYGAKDCVKRILNRMNVSEVVLSRNPEQTLKEWKDKQLNQGFDGFPEVAINNMLFRGNFDTDQIVQALCQSLSTPPQYCLNGGKQEQSSSQNHLLIILIVSILAIVLIAAIGTCLYRKFIKRELTNDMISRVGDLVANYANKVSKQKIRQKEKFIEANDQEL